MSSMSLFSPTLQMDEDPLGLVPIINCKPISKSTGLQKNSKDMADFVEATCHRFETRPPKPLLVIVLFFHEDGNLFGPLRQTFQFGFFLIWT
jgi:hypothetical protein